MIDVVLPVYATTERLEEMARESLRRIAGDGVRTIVVDNGWDEDRDFGADDYVRLSTNAGYAGGTNLGVRLSSSEIVVVSSLDVFVREGWETIVKVARRRKGIATPRAERWMYGFPTGDYELPHCDYWGGIMAFPRATYDALGGLDEERFRLRHSDVDFAIRAARAGFWVGRVPGVVVEHHDPSISTLLMGKAAVSEEERRLREVHGEFDLYAWRSGQFA